jgi:hypothetical protein
VTYITRSGYAADNDKANPAAGHLAKNILPPEEIMKIRLLLALGGSAIGFVAPSLAQQKETPDPQLRQVADALTAKFNEAWNSNDAAALASLLTVDAVLVTDTGPIYGRDAIEKMYVDLFKQVHFSNHIGKPDQYAPHIYRDGWQRNVVERGMDYDY